MNAQPILDESECWQAVLNRDRRYDGRFVTAVRTTGIYCRPSCPARHPQRKNVTFYPTPEAAAAAGYRACRRCRPDEVDSQVAMVKQACAYIDAHLDDAPTLEELGAQLHVSPFHLQRVFKREIGVSPRQYAESQRLQRFKAGLRDGESVTRALYDAGYNSSSSLYAGQLGMKPSEYRKGGRGMKIDYTIAPCTLGYLLVGTTERGICAVTIGDTPEGVLDALHEEYPAADISADSHKLTEPVSVILNYLDGDRTRIDLPLDIQATAFQHRVWEALREIPYGVTRSYTEIAREIGKPDAVRAVANACAANHVALVVPCHRVVREDGSLGGYKWGIERKRTLLEHEHEAQPVS
ncbi:MAG: bifunctional DNA-binding transcriptional regulator/O6-methylguanine-DNA methyltransferase Ada [Anaerolineae bacterium]